MSKDVVIKVDGVGKRYLIGRNPAKRILLETLMGGPRRIARAVGLGASDDGDNGDQESPDKVLWAIRDVSFEVEQGEVFGIVGGNGAGKSTLLKVLARITNPSRGEIMMKGRVGSLLEVGTGFHPELTGRENIYLNGAILGMRAFQVKKQFDEIVDFSGVERFLDTPVKRYSSGMRVRLGFAVAAFLDPEILVIDEVLAVGDAGFQRRCVSRMQDVAHSGRTVLFVSHNMSTVQSLTTRCMLMKSGRPESIGPTREIVEQYLDAYRETAITDVSDRPRADPTHGSKVRFHRIEPKSELAMGFRLNDDVVFEVDVVASETMRGLAFGLTVLDSSGSPVMSTSTPPNVDVEQGQRTTFDVRLSDTRLAPGSYAVAMSIIEGDLASARRTHDLIRPGPSFGVASVGVDGEALIGWSRGFGAVHHSRCELRRVATEACADDLQMQPTEASNGK